MFNNNPNKWVRYLLFCLSIVSQLFFYRPPGYPLPLPQEPADYNWKANEMPWKSPGEATAHTVMLFDGMSLNKQPSSSAGPSSSGQFNRKPRVKRRSESDDYMWVSLRDI